MPGNAQENAQRHVDRPNTHVDSVMGRQSPFSIFRNKPEVANRKRRGTTAQPYTIELVLIVDHKLYQL